ncbi:MAG: EAL domain-containing protein [Rhodoplanes sp.]|uniref:bifunctional diguanylate cyclase/phosphodiesterase n=1 Tax=Rhodoplanes sp. TaxID=1968906 RepID=UPI0017A827BB|nr:EAL domain-containing protein [Rhodoplanes sp.]NVO13412.1 EAL domain-containing protein [Rhodoplanes sp.]
MARIAGSLHHRAVFVSALLVCVLATLAVGLSVWQSRSDAIAEAVRSDRDTVAFLAGQLDHVVSEVDNVIKDYRDLAEIFTITANDGFQRQFTAGSLRDWMTAKLQQVRFAHHLSIADAAGTVVMSTYPGVNPQLDLADGDQFGDLRSSVDDRLSISLPQRSQATGEPILIFARRVNGPNGAFAGVVLLSVPIAHFDRMYNGAGFRRDRAFALARRDGTVLLRYPVDARRTGLKFPPHWPWHAMVAAGGGSYRSPGVFDGVVRWASVQPLAIHPIVVAISVPEESVLEKWRERSAYAAFGAVLLLGCLLTLLVILARQLRHLGASRAQLAAQSDSLASSNARLLDTNSQFAATLASMSQGLCMFDRAGVLRVCNDEFRRLYGLAPEVGPGATRDDLAIMRARRLKRVIARRDPLEELFEPARGDDAPELVELDNGRVIAVTGSPMADGGWLETHEDVTDRHTYEEQIEFLARCDPLTGVANRTSFVDRLQAARLALRKGGGAFAVLMVDLDRFKDVNDSVGHTIGDLVLQQTAERLAGALRPGDLLARLGGDEFAIIRATPRGADGDTVRPDMRDDALVLAGRIVDIVGEPYEVEGESHVVTTSVGIALAPVDGDEPVDLLKKADLALYRAKTHGGRNGFAFYDPSMTEEVEARHRLENDLRQAIAEDAFRLHYQPIVDVASGRVCAVEALIRWEHPTRGLLAPQEFIAVAEQTGLIARLGDWVLHAACAEAVRWPRHVKVAVNISPVQFRRADLLDTVMRALRAAGLPSERLEIEITESVLLENEERNVSVLHQLKSLGIAIALDDFGTGYSSLGYLTTFPFSKIKIDQRFTRDVLTRSDCAAIVCSAAALGLSLGMVVVAEGVETREQLEVVRITGVSQAQGYLFGAPVPPDEIALMLAMDVPRASASAEA